MPRLLPIRSAWHRASPGVRRHFAVTAALVLGVLWTALPAAAASPAVASLEVRIAAGSNDVEERKDGTLWASSSDLELIDDGGKQVVGLRFTGITLPPQARIMAAWVQFTVDERTTSGTSLQVRALAEANAAPFGGRRGVSSRPVGTAVNWTPAAWTTPGAAAEAQRTPDLAALIQVLVDRADWAAGNAIAFAITGSGRRTAQAYEGLPGAAALLHIDYAATPLANQPPVVAAAANPASLGAPGEVTLSASVADDGLPNPPGAVALTWAQTAGPATAEIADPAQAATSVRLPEAGVYSFQISASDGEAVVSSTVTVTAAAVPATGPTIRFAAFGDYGVGGTAEAAVAALVSGLGVDFVVTTGDNLQYAGTYDGMVGRYYAAYIGAYSGAYGPGSTRNRFFPALGNADYSNGSGGSAFTAFFDLPGAGFSSTSGSERYYDFVWGPVHFFVVDLYAAVSTQQAWLQAGMLASSAPWQVVVVHEPPYSSAGSSYAARWPYEAWGADAVLSGHAHVYERVMRDVNGDGTPIPYLTTGLGGASPGFLSTVTSGSAARYRGSNGALVVTACAGGMSFAFHSRTDGVVDQFLRGTPCP